MAPAQLRARGRGVPLLANASDRGEGARAVLYLMSAVLLHAGLTLLAWGPRVPAAPVPTEPAASELGIVPIALEAPKALSGALPGGGAAEPAPTPRGPVIPRSPVALRGVSQRSVAPATPSAPPVEPETPSDTPEVIAAVPGSMAADLVSQASNHAASASGSASSTALARVRPDESALGPYLGAGPGARGGPGGPGAGFGSGGGRLATPFAFGGPKGAFRAEVCFIPETTQSLRQIRGCKTEVTFFTDHLNVAPRGFTDGFPGITARTEWFAIYYRGTFRVQRADYFTFRLISDDGSLLYVDGHLIIDNDKRHPPASKLATVPLAAGEHLLNVEYYQGPRDRIALQLFVIGSDGHEKLFGPVI